MSTIYNQYVVTSVFVGQTGHTHVRVDDPKHPEVPTAIDCVSCEPFLVKEGWVYSPDLVPLTDTQVRNQEKATREGGQVVRWAAEQMAQQAASALVEANRRTLDEPQDLIVTTAPVSSGAEIVAPVPVPKAVKDQTRAKTTKPAKARQPAAVAK
jgi:hypothetical protein